MMADGSTSFYKINDVIKTSLLLLMIINVLASFIGSQFL